MSLEQSDSYIKGGIFTVPKQDKYEPLSDCVRNALESYFEQLNGHSINNLHQMVFEEVERPMFESVMDYTGGNQSKAAGILGISRSTLRKKLAYYGIG